MSSIDQRKHARYDTINLLHITVLDGSQVIHQGMGRTLNVSLSGILLETASPLSQNDEIGLSIGFQEEILEIRGRAVHCKPGGKGGYETGVSFDPMDETTRGILIKYIDLFESTKADP